MTPDNKTGFYHFDVKCASAAIIGHINYIANDSYTSTPAVEIAETCVFIRGSPSTYLALHSLRSHFSPGMHRMCLSFIILYTCFNKAGKHKPHSDIKYSFKKIKIVYVLVNVFN